MNQMYKKPMIPTHLYARFYSSLQNLNYMPLKNKKAPWKPRRFSTLFFNCYLVTVI